MKTSVECCTWNHNKVHHGEELAKCATKAALSFQSSSSCMEWAAGQQELDQTYPRRIFGWNSSFSLNVVLLCQEFETREGSMLPAQDFLWAWRQAINFTSMQRCLSREKGWVNWTFYRDSNCCYRCLQHWGCHGWAWSQACHAELTGKWKTN